MNLVDTIAAISTPPGTGAIALVRISGNECARVLQEIFKPSGQDKLPEQLSNRWIGHGWIHDEDETLDEVMVTTYRAPHSYTGEDLIEIGCHGSVYIQERMMQLILSKGVRLADPGEFTFRAFMNGKMDLTQAEAVADLIASGNRQMHQLALKQMRGGVSGKLRELRGALLEFASLLELELDFSQEDVEFADRQKLLQLLQDISEETGKLINSFKLGNAIKKGVPVAIIGKPNAGKSTLLNALLREEKAIVSELPGTTRDAIEDTIIIEDIPFRFIDTAGLRKEPGRIEAMGIEKTFEKIHQAAIVLYIFDASSTTIEEIKEEMASLFAQMQENTTLEELEEKRFILVANKIDMLMEVPHHFGDYVEMEVVFISAKRNENIGMLTSTLLKSIDTSKLQELLVITNLRHYEALHLGLEAITEAGSALRAGIPPDLIAVDIRKALYHLGLITGEVTNDELLSNIFGRFCIGK